MISRSGMVFCSPRRRLSGLALLGGVAVVGLAFAAAMSSPAALAQTLPTGARVVGGQAAFADDGLNLKVHQSTPAAIISWETFSIGQPNSVYVDNGSGATLNRVRGNVASQIDGSLTATGSLYLINPAGIAVGSTGRIETGGSFVGSTLELSDEEFAKAARGQTYTLKGGSSATVRNAGRIGALGGDVALIGRTVENMGDIDAPNGTAALAAGTEVLVQEVLIKDRALDGGRFIVKAGGAGTVVRNSGNVRAAEVELRANGGNVYALAGNRSGVIAATGTAGRGGRVFLTAGEGGTVEVTQPVTATRSTDTGEPRIAARNADGGRRTFLSMDGAGNTSVTQRASAARRSAQGGEIRVSGSKVRIAATLDASGRAATPAVQPLARPAALDGDGGRVIITGETITLTDTARIDVSGARDIVGSRGGIALIGGDFQGGKDAANNYVAEKVATAKTLSVAAGATVAADGAGDAGRIVLWSDDRTDFAGHVSATSVAGRGGDAEVSGKAVLAFTGTADLLGPDGAGTLLLDPYDIRIVSANPGDGSTAATGSGTPTGAYTGTGTPANNTSYLLATTLQTALGSASVVIRTGSDTAIGGNGDITVATAITWNSVHSLTLEAHRHINVNANITANNAASKVTLRADATGIGTGTVTFGAGIKAKAPAGLEILYSPTSYDAPVTYAGNAETGTTATAYMLVNNLTQLQSIGGSAARLGRTYALGRDIDAAASATMNSGAGFAPLGTSASNSFAGVFDGRGQIITGLTINRPGENYVGLFGYTSNATIRNIGLVGGALTGGSVVGGLVGQRSYAATDNITDAYWDTASTGITDVNKGIGSNGSTSGTINIKPVGGGNPNPYASGTYTGFDFTSGGAWHIFDGDTRPLLKFALDAFYDAATNTYFVHSAEALQLVRRHTDAGISNGKTYKLISDLTLNPASGGVSVSGVWKTATVGGEARFNFVPIGTSSASFQGTFDGQGHVINGLTIERPTADYVGLFGRTSGATIENLGIVGGSVTGNGYVGSLVGNAHDVTSIRNVYTSASVQGLGLRVGGLVGYLTGGSTIGNAWATGAVSGAGYVGGLMGSANRDGNPNTGVSNAWASGAVTGGSDARVGGLAGTMDGVFLTNVYATGLVTGTTQVGGLVGLQTAGTITTSYWDSDTTGKSSGIGSVTGGSGTPAAVRSKTATVNAFTKTAYAFSSFDTNWYIVDGETRPMLRMTLDELGKTYDTAGAVVAGTYTILNAEQLQLLGAHTDKGSSFTSGKTYLLANDINVGAAFTDSSVWRKGFQPIGTASLRFEGTLRRPGPRHQGSRHRRDGAIVGSLRRSVRGGIRCDDPQRRPRRRLGEGRRRLRCFRRQPRRASR